jgi:O-antigen/teichoic acid export membrane protein
MNTKSGVSVFMHWFISYLKDPLHKNSSFLIGSKIANGIFGFFFWIITAHLYAPSVVGISTALISAGNLIATFSCGSFYIGMIRFLPEEKDKSNMINVCFTIAGIIGLLLVLIFVVGLNIWSPALVLLHQNFVLLLVFILFSVAATLSALQTSVFIALRATVFYFIQTLVSGLRIAILALMIPLGLAGVFSSFVGGTFFALVAAFIFIRRLEPAYRPKIILEKKVVGKMFGFSIGNFIADSFKQLPGMVMPLIVINILNASSNAYFFIAWMISTIFMAVPYSVHDSMLA